MVKIHSLKCRTIIKRNNLLPAVYVLLLTTTFFEISTYIKNIIFAFLFITFALIYIKDQRKTNLNSVKIKILKIISTLMLVFLFVSVIVLYNNELAILIPRNLVTVGMILTSIYTAYLANSCFEERNIKYICSAIIINYALTIILFAYNNLFNIQSNAYTILGMGPVLTLEISELSFVAGIMSLYLLTNKQSKKMPIITMLIPTIALISFKRISMLAMVIVFIILCLEKYKIKNTDKTIKLTKIITYISVFTYLMLMTVFMDKTLNFINNIGVNMNWRDHFYRMIYASRSSLSPFLGTGIRFTDYKLSIDPTWSFVKAIHSDILRLYLENGIILFAVYIYTYTSSISNALKKTFNDRSRLIYNLLILYTFICYMTDNLFTYYKYIFVLFAIIFELATIAKKQKDDINETSKRNS